MSTKVSRKVGSFLRPVTASLRKWLLRDSNGEEQFPNVLRTKSARLIDRFRNTTLRKKMGNATLNTEDLRFELNRLNTFESWPSTAAISRDRLARAGFFYNGTGQQVSCYACGLQISDWSYNDQAMQKHRQFSPNCSFVHNTSDNVPLHTSTASSPTSSDSSLPEDVAVSRGRADMVWRNFKSLHKESERRKTFLRGWPLTFISPEELSRAGFFFLRQKDMVQCIFCRGIVLDWEPGDIPMNEHARHFPMCPFVRDADVGNVTYEEEMEMPESDRTNSEEFPSGHDECGIHMWDMALGSVPERQVVPDEDESDLYYHGEAKYPMFASPLARMRTFERWPKQFPQQPQDMVYAGFFYSGVSDHVKCFCCGQGLRNWERNDDPWVEHARWFGSCKFIQFSKGRGFVEDARKRKPPVLPGKVDCEDECSTSKYETVTKHGGSMLPYTNGYDVSPSHEEDHEGVPAMKSEGDKQETASIVRSMNGMKFNENTSDEDVNLKDLLEENRSLRERRMCKICMDEEVGVVLRPCGHVVSCVNCSPALLDCPICRKPIHSSLRVFFS